jgi:triosephosphate isomerase
MNYIIANWKMKMTSQDVLKWYEVWADLPQKSYPDIKVIVAPSHLHLPLIATAAQKTFLLAAQDVSKNAKGAHTGDTGSFQLKEFCKYAIVGHSERNEDKTVVMEKIDRCLEEGITPIVCFIETQTAVQYSRDDIVLAWEDPDNISVNGQYKDKSISETVDKVEEIRKSIPKNIPLLYGGSVNRQNVKNLVEIKGLNGVLVGNASLDPKHFSELVEAYAK